VVVDGNHVLAGKVVELEVTLLTVDALANSSRAEPQLDKGGKT
jgi:FKBP-type peptidyl-prolyl cis-trans isomerase 2